MKTKLLRAYRLLRRYPLLPIFIIIALVIMAIFAPVLAPSDPLHSSLEKVKTPPVWLAGGTSEYLLGADNIGRDLLSRIIHGSRISLMVAGIVLITGGGVGTVLGIVAGYTGGARVQGNRPYGKLKLARPGPRVHCRRHEVDPIIWTGSGLS